MNNNFEDPENHYKLFFKKEYRKKKEFENYFISESIEKIFNDVYYVNREKCLLKINSPNEHPLLNLIMKSEDLINIFFNKEKNPLSLLQKNTNPDYIIPMIEKSFNITKHINNLKEKNITQKKSNLNFTIEKKWKNPKNNTISSTNLIKETENLLNAVTNYQETKVNDNKPVEVVEEINIKKINFNKKILGKKILPNFKHKNSEREFTENNKTHKNIIQYNPLLLKSSINENNITKIQSKNHKNICCDEIFFEYLKIITKLANLNYFKFVFKFIIIFRECINTYKNIELENSILVLHENIPKDIKEFTQYYDAEQAPELCNEFISEYLVSCDYFGFEKDFIPEIVDIIQHFCYWMYENNYTSSRLSLLSV